MKLGRITLNRYAFPSYRRDRGFFNLGTWRHWHFGYAHPRTGILTVQKFGKRLFNWSRNTHDTTMEIDVADKSIELFIEFTFNAGCSDYFAGGCWNPGDPDEMELVRMEVITGTKESPIYTQAPDWLFDLLNDSDQINEHIGTVMQDRLAEGPDYDDRD